MRITASPVAKVHDELVAAAGDGDVWVVGGGDLAGQFADLGLLDEVIVNIAPVTLGSGKPLLPRHVELRLAWRRPPAGSSSPPATRWSADPVAGHGVRRRWTGSGEGVVDLFGGLGQHVEGAADLLRHPAGQPAGGGQDRGDR